MIGDSLGYVSGRLPANLRPGLILSDNSITGSAPIALSGSAFKIADNDSPRPQDRVYLDVNYFTAVLNSLKAPGGATQTFVRETFGFESTFLDGNASIEMRVPFFQTHLDSGVVAGAATSASDFGDVTLIGKYVLWSDPGTGSLLSTGVALTLPTGPTYNVTLTNAVTGAVVRTDSVNPTIFQPFVGFMYFLSENLYVHGFSSLAIPFSESVSTDWFNDIGVGWYAWRDGNCSLNAIVPTAELHIETPFGNQGVFSYPIGELDTWVVTLGAHLLFHNHSELTFAYESPLSGPRPFQSEYVCQFNYHF